MEIKLVEFHNMPTNILMEMASMIVKELDRRRAAKCTMCKGTGWVRTEKGESVCALCKGTGCEL